MNRHSLFDLSSLHQPANSADRAPQNELRRDHPVGEQDPRSQKQTALAIGGTSGIGLAIAKGLAQAGANVVPTGRPVEHAQTAAREIVFRKKRCWLHFFATDVTHPYGCGIAMDALHRAVMNEAIAIL